MTAEIIIKAAGGGKTGETWQPRLDRDISLEDARQIVENVTGFFSVLAEWALPEMPEPVNGTGELAGAASTVEGHHDR